MNAAIQPIPTLDDLIHRATHDHECLVDFVHAQHLNNGTLIAARALTAALDDIEFETGLPASMVPESLVAVALARLIGAGWDAREAFQVEGCLEQEAADRPVAPEYERYVGV